ncbi:MAG: hypothetical protein KDM63_09025 [Verrucomicrobiae bacterium]|nr:hypothetical protein [Verrucomicrobiae bacterium]
MKPLSTISLSLAAISFCQSAARADGWLDEVEEALTFNLFGDAVSLHFSGLGDVEGYVFDGPAPGLLYTDNEALFNPRLSLFLDAQAGPHLYGFVQARLDRGFDPSDENAEMRIDEYAIRFTPWEDGRIHFQAGQFGTVVGNWMSRHLSWDNPFVTAPVPYENQTGIYGGEAPESRAEFLEHSDGEGYDYSPILWGPSYATGASISGQIEKVTYAAEIKNASLSSHPDSWGGSGVNFKHPTVSGRLGLKPNHSWDLGTSFSDGSYLRPKAAPTLPAHRGIGDYHQTVIGQDISYSWHHLQLWAECYHAQFEVPRVGNAETLAYYIEAKYRFSPELYGAARWNQQLFESIRGDDGIGKDWGDDMWRCDLSIGYRFTAHTQLKLQYSLQHAEGADQGISHLFATQFTTRF